MRKLTVKGRYLSWEDGKPFFYLGDTAWEMLHKLSREEVDHYLSVRSRQGFTAIQTVALAEQEGVTVPNYYGRLLFILPRECRIQRSQIQKKNIPIGNMWITS
jgi:hypothetical protein